MRLFSCAVCANVIWFENSHCEACGSRLGFDPASTTLHALAEADQAWRAADGTAFRFCDNAEFGACNWLIPADQDDRFCVACRHNQIIPDLSLGSNLLHWRRMEQAKHHLFYSLLRFGLPFEPSAAAPGEGLTFQFLAEDPSGDVKILTGHNDGTITLNLAEADDGIREQRRLEMREPYRTLLGHFRHEIGHYFWDRLIRDGDRLQAFRDCFGDETQDYDEALKFYYANGPAANWPENFVSAYATAHPWEDFAETWAHYLHITDTLEMAGSCGIRVDPVVTEDPSLTAVVDFDPFFAQTIEQLVDRWHPVAIAVNSINRCMGQPDLYPFVLAPAVFRKLGFIHALVHGEIVREAPEPAVAAPAL